MSDVYDRRSAVIADRPSTSADTTKVVHMRRRIARSVISDGVVLVDAPVLRSREAIA